MQTKLECVVAFGVCYVIRYRIVSSQATGKAAYSFLKDVNTCENEIIGTLCAKFVHTQHILAATKISKKAHTHTNTDTNIISRSAPKNCMNRMNYITHKQTQSKQFRVKLYISIMLYSLSFYLHSKWHMHVSFILLFLFRSARSLRPWFLPPIRLFIFHSTLQVHCFVLISFLFFSFSSFFTHFFVELKHVCFLPRFVLRILHTLFYIFINSNPPVW